MTTITYDGQAVGSDGTVTVTDGADGANGAVAPPPSPATAKDVTDSVVASFGNSEDVRLGELATALVRHLHAFVEEVGLTESEWWTAVDFLTRTGQTCSASRQEFILLSDVLGVSTLVDLANHEARGGMTESTITGPFYVPGSPSREYGASTAERNSGDPAWFTGRVLDPAGQPVAGAELDVWQNGDDMRYAVQDRSAPPTNLRGIYRTRDDGSYALLGVRPVDYPIPHDGPVGSLLARAGRHPWRPAHLHMTVRSPGFVPVTTHVFDLESSYLDSDAVFGVKPSLVRRFDRHEPGEPGRPQGVGSDQVWYSVVFDVVLRRETETPPPPGMP